jgi:hypothetical protein
VDAKTKAKADKNRQQDKERQRAKRQRDAEKKLNSVFMNTEFHYHKPSPKHWPSFAPIAAGPSHTVLKNLSLP